MSETKRCGTCRWRDDSEPAAFVRYCGAPMPSSVVTYHTRLVKEDDGTTCPAWSPKPEEPAAERAPGEEL